MMYEYSFSGTITVEADSEEEAFDLAEELIAVTAYQAEHCEDISIGDLCLEDVDE